jgi:serine/threonine protein phosphatase 1
MSSLSDDDAAEPRLIAIGDIHGCLAALDRLLQEINPRREDLVVTLGDYVDRGPDSCGVVSRLIELGSRTHLVGMLGNHEQMMLDVIRHGAPHQAWLRYGGVETLDSYGFHGNLDFLPPDHQAFFDSLGDYFEHGDYFFTHAAYDPDLPLDQQTQEMLRWHSLRDGVPAPHMSGRTAVVGHTANREGEIFDAGHLLCIDTFCYGGGWLTAIELPSKRIWQASQDGLMRDLDIGTLGRH